MKHRPRHHSHDKPAAAAAAPADPVKAFHIGSHVWADFGAGYKLAHVEDDGHTNEQGETKYAVQNPQTGDAEDLTWREPGDVDAAGTGRTFKTL